MSLWKKIPLWAKIIFPVAFLLVLFFALRGGGRGMLRWLSSSPEPSIPLPPAISPKEAEKAREEITEELKAGEKKAETEAEELKRKVREKFGTPKTTVIILGLTLALWGAGCARTPQKVLGPTYLPTKAPTEALINRCENSPEKREVICPLDIFIKSIDNFADLWEYSQKCAHRLTACQKFGAVDRLEMQGKINTETARADKNARWIWYTVGGGLVVSIAAFFVGALAF